MAIETFVQLAVEKYRVVTRLNAGERKIEKKVSNAKRYDQMKVHRRIAMMSE